MEEYLNANHYPALLDLRGHFYLEPDLVVHDPNWPPDYPMEVFPITDDQALLVRAQSTSLINLPSGEALWTITCPALEAALDVKRNRLALGAKGWAYLWDLQSGSLIQTFPLDDDIPTTLAFHPQGHMLAIAPFANDIQLWQLSDGSVQVLSSEEYAASNDYTCYKSIAFSPDGQFLADGNFEAGDVWLWQIPDGQLAQQMEPSGGRVEGLAFSPDGQLLVCGEAGGGNRYTDMRVWDMRTRQAVQSFPRSDWWPAFSPDGKLLAAGDLSFIGIWDVETRKRRRFIPAHKGRLHRLHFSPSGQVLVSIGDRQPTIRWWEVEGGREIYRMS